MKLVCLNVWGGKKYRELAQFIKEQSKDTDIFCLQEVFRSSTSKKVAEGYRTDLFSIIEKLLPEFAGYFAPMCKGVIGFNPVSFADFDAEFGLAIFVRNNIKIKFHGSKIVHKGKKNIKDPRIDLPIILQYVKILKGTKPVAIFNFHGLSTWPKVDTKERLQQSRRAKDFIDKFQCKKILCGDFNIAPDTKSIRILGACMNNLVIQSGIESTRSSLVKHKQGISDYIIVSEGIKVDSFKVVESCASDHLPLILEFE